jgi:hypothetical protein
MSVKQDLYRDAGTHRDASSSTFYRLEKVVKPLGKYTQSREYASKEKCVPVRPCVPADALHELARMVRRLSPDRRNPERFHEEKSEVAASLIRIAHSLGNTR